jgi:hypothetical protein
MNTGISAKVIERIKQHVFFEEHILRDHIGKFKSDPDMATAWLRLTDGTYVQSDLVLLQHEYSESLLMRRQTANYDNAHAIVNKIYNWETAARK